MFISPRAGSSELSKSRFQPGISFLDCFVSFNQIREGQGGGKVMSAITSGPPLGPVTPWTFFRNSHLFDLTLTQKNADYLKKCKVIRIFLQ